MVASRPRTGPGRARSTKAELEHQLASQRRLLEVNERLLSTLDPHGVLEMIADSLRSVVSYDTLGLYVVDWDAGVRRAVVARDRFADVILAHASPIYSGVTGWAIEHGEAVLCNDAHLDPRSTQIPGTPFEPESMVIVPLVVAGRVEGTLNVGRIGGKEAHFSANEFDLTKLFAAQASIALQNAETHRALETRAELDSLTGLRNHGAFQRELGEAVAASDGSPFAVLLMDLDEFKAYNDTHGHPAGDTLLRSIGAAMASTVREGDRLYRYGGDEFAVLLPATDRGRATNVAERIELAVDGLFPAADRSRVSVSVGIACFPADGRTKDELVVAADRALYLVKPSVRGHAAGRLAGHDDPAVDVYVAALARAEDALRHSEERFQRLSDTTTDAVVIARDGVVLEVNQALSALVGLPAERLIGRSILEFTAPISRAFIRARMEAPSDEPIEALAVDALGEVFPVEITSRTIHYQGGEARLSSLRDLRERRAMEERLAHQALYDSVTGLPNRVLLVDRVRFALASVRTGDDIPLALMILDLDRFKVVNESLGHAAGDHLLRAVGERLTAILRPGDTVARFGGDEFGILLDRVGGGDEASSVADRISAALAAPFELSGRDMFITASIGIVVGRPGEAEPDDLLRDAEIALYRAKADSTMRHAIFEPSMSAAMIERLDLENDLRRAIDREELLVYYQPLIDLATDRIAGLEALVRWQHPVRGLVPPLAFIPLAEETGLILPIGRWVLETACRQARELQLAFPSDTPLSISVNLSPRQFLQPDLVDGVAAILAETGIPPSSLELEITESVVMEDAEAGIRVLKALRGLGCRLALDDFGTGYSSLSYLKSLPLDTLKIDRSFVAGLADDGANLPIVQAVIALAHGLGIDVTAEGIETAEQLGWLRDLVCDRGQGFYYARPLPPSELIPLLGPDAPPIGRPLTGPTRVALTSRGAGRLARDTHPLR
jgi:diguanylate cyclase (GGDEF)-like protein/PAS domain S-box-containing protein